MAKLWKPTKRIHIEIVRGSKHDGVWIDSTYNTDLENHMIAMLELAEVGQELEFSSYEQLLQKLGWTFEGAPLTERYTVISRLEEENEVLIQVQLAQPPKREVS